MYCQSDGLIILIMNKHFDGEDYELAYQYHQSLTTAPNEIHCINKMENQMNFRIIYRSFTIKI